MDDKYWPRDTAEPEQKVSLMNEAITFRDTGDSTVLHKWPKARPLHAVIAETLANVELLLAQLESAVRVPDNQTAVVRELFVCSSSGRCWQRPCGWRSWNRALLPVIGWTQVAFEFLQGVAKRPPIFHE
jgi:hypothetical protein